MHKRFKFSAAIFTLTTFIFTQFNNTPAFAAAQMPVSEIQIGAAGNFTLPTELGTVDSLDLGQGPMIVHIQTAHGNFEAQKNIQNILEFLKKNYGFTTLLLEGSAYPLNPEIIRFFPDDMKLTHAIAEDLTRKALFKGADLFMIDNPTVKALGIEDVDLYRENGDAFRSVLRQEAATENFVSDMNMQIERLTSPYMNKDLRSFLNRLDAYESKQVQFQDWVNTLKQEAMKHLGLDLEDPMNQIESPMLLRLFTLMKFEAKLDRSAFDKEKTAFLKAIHRLPKNVYTQIEKLLTQPVNRNQLPSPETELLFEKMVEGLPSNFNYKAFPNVSLFIGHLILQSEIKALPLMSEVSSLQDKIAERLAITKEEKQILGLLKDHRLLKRLFALQLTPNDYEEVLARGNDMKPAQVAARFEKLNTSKRVKNVKFTNIEKINELYAKSIEFYRLVKARDLAMLKNVPSRMKAAGVEKAVVITGGFHAEPFREFAQGQGFQYALISPKITTDKGHEAYVRTVLATELKELTRSTYETVFVGVDSPELLQNQGVDPNVVVRGVAASAKGLKVTADRFAGTRFAQVLGGRKASITDSAAATTVELAPGVTATVGKLPPSTSPVTSQSRSEARKTEAKATETGALQILKDGQVVHEIDAATFNKDYGIELTARNQEKISKLFDELAVKVQSAVNAAGFYNEIQVAFDLTGRAKLLLGKSGQAYYGVGAATAKSIAASLNEMIAGIETVKALAAQINQSLAGIQFSQNSQADFSDQIKNAGIKNISTSHIFESGKGRVDLVFITVTFDFVKNLAQSFTGKEINTFEARALLNQIVFSAVNPRNESEPTGEVKADGWWQDMEDEEGDQYLFRLEMPKFSFLTRYQVKADARKAAIRRSEARTDLTAASLAEFITTMNLGRDSLKATVTMREGAVNPQKLNIEFSSTSTYGKDLPPFVQSAVRTTTQRLIWEAIEKFQFNLPKQFPGYKSTTSSNTDMEFFLDAPRGLKEAAKVSINNKKPVNAAIEPIRLEDLSYGPASWAYLLFEWPESKTKMASYVTYQDGRLFKDGFHLVDGSAINEKDLPKEIAPIRDAYRKNPAEEWLKVTAGKSVYIVSPEGKAYKLVTPNEHSYTYINPTPVEFRRVEEKDASLAVPGGKSFNFATSTGVVRQGRFGWTWMAYALDLKDRATFNAYRNLTEALGSISTSEAQPFILRAQQKGSAQIDSYFVYGQPSAMRFISLGAPANEIFAMDYLGSIALQTREIATMPQIVAIEGGIIPVDGNHFSLRLRSEARVSFPSKQEISNWAAMYHDGNFSHLPGLNSEVWKELEADNSFKLSFESAVLMAENENQAKFKDLEGLATALSNQYPDFLVLPSQVRSDRTITYTITFSRRPTESLAPETAPRSEARALFSEISSNDVTVMWIAGAVAGVVLLLRLAYELIPRIWHKIAPIHYDFYWYRDQFERLVSKLSSESKEGVVPELIAKTQGDNAFERLAAYAALVRRGEKQYVPGLLNSLFHDTEQDSLDQKKAFEIFRQYSELNADERFEAISKILEGDPDGAVRSQALKILQRTASFTEINEKKAALIVGRLSDPSEDVRVQALEISRYRKLNIDESLLLNNLKHTSVKVRLEAAQVVAALMNREAAVLTLKQALSFSGISNAEKIALVNLLANLGDKSGADLMAKIIEFDDKNRNSAWEVLMRIGDASHLKMIATGLQRSAKDAREKTVEKMMALDVSPDLLASVYFGILLLPRFENSDITILTEAIDGLTGRQAEGSISLIDLTAGKKNYYETVLIASARVLELKASEAYAQFGTDVRTGVLTAVRNLAFAVKNDPAFQHKAIAVLESFLAKVPHTYEHQTYDESDAYANWGHSGIVTTESLENPVYRQALDLKADIEQLVSSFRSEVRVNEILIAGGVLAGVMAIGAAVLFARSPEAQIRQITKRIVAFKKREKEVDERLVRYAEFKRKHIREILSIRAKSPNLLKDVDDGERTILGKLRIAQDVYDLAVELHAGSNFKENIKRLKALLSQREEIVNSEEAFFIWAEAFLQDVIKQEGSRSEARAKHKEFFANVFLSKSPSNPTYDMRLLAAIGLKDEAEYKEPVRGFARNVFYSKSPSNPTFDMRLLAGLILSSDPVERSLVQEFAENVYSGRSPSNPSITMQLLAAMILKSEAEYKQSVRDFARNVFYSKSPSNPTFDMRLLAGLILSSDPVERSLVQEFAENVYSGRSPSNPSITMQLLAALIISSSRSETRMSFPTKQEISNWAAMYYDGNFSHLPGLNSEVWKEREDDNSFKLSFESAVLMAENENQAKFRDLEGLATALSNQYPDFLVLPSQARSDKTITYTITFSPRSTESLELETAPRSEARLGNNILLSLVTDLEKKWKPSAKKMFEELQILTVAQLVQYSMADLRMSDSAKPDGLKQIKQVLEDQGLKLRESAKTPGVSYSHRIGSILYKYPFSLSSDAKEKIIRKASEENGGIEPDVSEFLRFSWADFTYLNLEELKALQRGLAEQGEALRYLGKDNYAHRVQIQLNRKQGVVLDAKGPNPIRIMIGTMKLKSPRKPTVVTLWVKEGDQDWKTVDLELNKDQEFGDRGVDLVWLSSDDQLALEFTGEIKTIDWETKYKLKRLNEAPVFRSEARSMEARGKVFVNGALIGIQAPGTNSQAISTVLEAVFPDQNVLSKIKSVEIIGGGQDTPVYGDLSKTEVDLTHRGLKISTSEPVSSRSEARTILLRVMDSQKVDNALVQLAKRTTTPAEIEKAMAVIKSEAESARDYFIPLNVVLSGVVRQAGDQTDTVNLNFSNQQGYPHKYFGEMIVAIKSLLERSDETRYQNMNGELKTIISDFFVAVVAALKWDSLAVSKAGSDVMADVLTLTENITAHALILYANISFRKEYEKETAELRGVIQNLVTSLRFLVSEELFDGDTNLRALQIAAQIENSFNFAQFDFSENLGVDGLTFNLAVAKDLTIGTTDLFAAVANFLGTKQANIQQVLHTDSTLETNTVRLTSGYLTLSPGDLLTVSLKQSIAPRSEARVEETLTPRHFTWRVNQGWGTHARGIGMVQRLITEGKLQGIYVFGTYIYVKDNPNAVAQMVDAIAKKAHDEKTDTPEYFRIWYPGYTTLFIEESNAFGPSATQFLLSKVAGMRAVFNQLLQDRDREKGLSTNQFNNAMWARLNAIIDNLYLIEKKATSPAFQLTLQDREVIFDAAQFIISNNLAVRSEARAQLQVRIQQAMANPANKVVMIEEARLSEIYNPAQLFLNSGRENVVILRNRVGGFEGVDAEMLLDKNGKSIGVTRKQIEDGLTGITDPVVVDEIRKEMLASHKEKATEAQVVAELNAWVKQVRDRVRQELDAQGYVDTEVWPDNLRGVLASWVRKVFAKSLLSQEMINSIEHFEKERFATWSKTGLKVEWRIGAVKYYYYPNVHPTDLKIQVNGVEKNIVLGGHSPIVLMDDPRVQILGSGDKTIAQQHMIIRGVEGSLNPAQTLILISRNPKAYEYLTQGFPKEQVIVINPDSAEEMAMLNDPKTFNARSEVRISSDDDAVANVQLYLPKGSTTQAVVKADGVTKHKSRINVALATGEQFEVAAARQRENVYVKVKGVVYQLKPADSKGIFKLDLSKLSELTRVNDPAEINKIFPQSGVAPVKSLATKASAAEIATGAQYFDGKIATDPVKADFRPSRTSDLTFIPGLTEEESRRYVRIALESIAKGEGVFTTAAAGASSRMNVKEAPPEAREMAHEIFGEGYDIKSKAAVPVGRDENGKVYTYLGLMLENISRLEREVAAILPESKPNDVLIMTNSDYQSELDRELQVRDNYGLQPGQIIRNNGKNGFQQDLGAKYLATAADAKKVYDALIKNAKDDDEKAAIKTKYEAHLARVETIKKSGNPEEIVIDEKDPLGHGEFLHQMVSKGILLDMLEKGKKWVSFRNVDNTAATFSYDWLVSLGIFLDQGLQMQPEVSLRIKGQKGGGLIVTKEGNHQLTEDPSFEATLKEIVKSAEAEGYKSAEPKDELDKLAALLAQNPLTILPSRMSFEQENIATKEELSKLIEEGKLLVFKNASDEYKLHRKVTSMDTAGFNDAVDLETPEYISGLYFLPEQTLEQFIEEMRQARRNGTLEAIAERGRARFPKLVDPKPGKNQENFAAVKLETNKWQSTAIAHPNHKIRAVAVNGIANIDQEAFLKMSPEEQDEISTHLRMLATKQWAGPAESYVSNKPYISSLIRVALKNRLFPSDILSDEPVARAEVRTNVLPLGANDKFDVFGVRFTFKEVFSREGEPTVRFSFRPDGKRWVVSSEHYERTLVNVDLKPRGFTNRNPLRMLRANGQEIYVIDQNHKGYRIIVESIDLANNTAKIQVDQQVQDLRELARSEKRQVSELPQTQTPEIAQPALTVIREFLAGILPLGLFNQLMSSGVATVSAAVAYVLGRPVIAAEVQSQNGNEDVIDSQLRSAARITIGAPARESFIEVSDLPTAQTATADISGKVFLQYSAFESMGKNPQAMRLLLEGFYDAMFPANKPVLSVVLPAGVSVEKAKTGLASVIGNKKAGVADALAVKNLQSAVEFISLKPGQSEAGIVNDATEQYEGAVSYLGAGDIVDLNTPAVFGFDLAQLSRRPSFYAGAAMVALSLNRLNKEIRGKNLTPQIRAQKLNEFVAKSLDNAVDRKGNVFVLSLARIIQNFLASRYIETMA